MFEVFNKVGNFFMDIIEVFVVSMSIFIVVYLFLMQPHQVKGSSMFPTFHDGEYLMTDKITYKTREPKRGDVVIFKAPINEEVDFIKRVIGEPGDRVMVKDSKVYVNGNLLNEDYLPSEYKTYAGKAMSEGQEVVVPPDSIIAFGDNREHSSDSREWGFVPYKNIIGRAFFRYWPVSRAGVIENPSY